MARRTAPGGRTAEDLIIEFCVEGVALSARAKVRADLRAWQEKIASQAKAAAGDARVIVDAVDVRISEFSETRTRDRDNVAKPILDALQGIVSPTIGRCCASKAIGATSMVNTERDTSRRPSRLLSPSDEGLSGSASTVIVAWRP